MKRHKRRRDDLSPSRLKEAMHRLSDGNDKRADVKDTDDAAGLARGGPHCGDGRLAGDPAAGGVADQ